MNFTLLTRGLKLVLSLLLCLFTGPACQGTQAAYDACVQSLQHLQMDYVDLYLIHWPGISKLKPHEEGHAEARRQSWMTLERLQKEGKASLFGL